MKEEAHGRSGRWRSQVAHAFRAVKTRGRTRARPGYPQDLRQDCPDLQRAILRPRELRPVQQGPAQTSAGAATRGLSTRPAGHPAGPNQLRDRVPGAPRRWGSESPSLATRSRRIPPPSPLPPPPAIGRRGGEGPRAGPPGWPGARVALLLEERGLRARSLHRNASSFQIRGNLRAKGSEGLESRGPRPCPRRPRAKIAHFSFRDQVHPGGRRGSLQESGPF